MIQANVARVVCTLAIALGFASVAHAQILEAVDDRYGIPFGLPLQVEAFGVLDNDLLDGENAGENGATAVLVTDVSHGTLALNDDGSFTYEVGTSFDGTDQFVYRAEFGSASDEATVVLSACDGGPEVFTCWNESAFLAEVQALGLFTFREGFEDDAIWGGVRTPDSAPSVVSQGIEWRSNHPDPPASNPISTTSGPPHSGQWAVYDPNHGYATGSPAECDIDDPPEHCLYYDGVTGTRVPGEAVLHGVGAYFNGIFGANVGILIDGAAPIGGGRLTFGHEFFGVIDARAPGFTEFQFRELDGKVGQALFVWGDDFTLVTEEPVSVPQAIVGVAASLRVSPNPTRYGATIRVALPSSARVRLSIFDVTGRLVRELVDGRRAAGTHSLSWDERDADGRAVARGVYFARLVTVRSGVKEVSSQAIVVSR